MKHKENQTYKSISEVAKILNLITVKNGTLSTHTLRYWEKEFKQIKPKILNGKRRYYDVRNIELLKKVCFLLKEQGMTIKGVKNQLLNNDSKLDETFNTSINTKNILKSKLSKISKIVKDLKK